MKLLKNRFLKNCLLLVISFLLVEIIFRLISSIPVFDMTFLRITIGAFVLAIVISFIFSWTNNLINKIANFIFVFAACFYAWIQLGFNNFIGTYMSINTRSQLGAVIDYIKEFLASFFWQYYLMFIPFVLLILYYIFIDKHFTSKGKKFSLKYPFKFEPIVRVVATSIIVVVLCILYNMTLYSKNFQTKFQTISNANLFRYPSVPSLAVNQFGIIGYAILDMKSINQEDPNEYDFDDMEIVIPINNNTSSDPENENTKTRTIDDTNWLKIIEEETNKKYNKINNYLINQKITDYNEMTGIFKGKNLIVIMGESVNDIFINKEYFPNFYKLYSEGFAFVNNYSPRNTCATGNNEFSGMSGLYTIQNNCTANIYKSNTYFEGIFNLFNNDGYSTTGMHDYTEAYYSRGAIHRSLGSQKYYGVKDLKIPFSYEYINWASDTEFLSKAMDIVLEDTSKPFMTWLTTVTAHQPYSSSIEGDMYLDFTKDSGYPMEIRRYMSKLKYLDDGIGIMLEKLEKAGVLDDTVIVLYGDHYPYGMKSSTISKALDYDLSDYEIERVPLVIYNSATPGKEIDRYTSYINLTPTIANLFDLDYDPRYYMGTDVFSPDYLNVVSFVDGSWKNDVAYYNASKSKIKYYGDTTYDDEQIMYINTTITNKMQISKEIIQSNYFNYLKKKLDALEEEQRKQREQELKEQELLLQNEASNEENNNTE